MENEKTINKKSFSRFFATQILFSYFFNKNEINENIVDLKSFLEEYYILDEFSINSLEEYKKMVNLDFLNTLLLGTIEHIEDIDNFLNKNIEGKYTFSLIDKKKKIILRLATFEFYYTDTDKKIIINEYVDIAGEYFDEKAISFVNAILDNLSKIINN